MHDMIQEHGRVRVLLYLDENFQGWETEVIRSEPFGHRHKDNFQKIAGDSWRLSLEMELFAPFLAGEVRNFTGLNSRKPGLG